MTIEDLYNKVLADNELKVALAEAVNTGTVAEWAAGQGVEATLEEVLAYAKAATESDLISEKDLSKVAGGGENGPSLSVILALQNIGCPPDSK